ncbi:hypothetical protein [Kiloniella majae]|uniref:hypothetical protein n=1 Tax=Kiloniella majae TaxID=1938558 RepID=UPI000A278B06|nr:hypothetical protein [Kiloniella majae]
MTSEIKQRLIEIFEGCLQPSKEELKSNILHSIKTHKTDLIVNQFIEKRFTSTDIEKLSYEQLVEVHKIILTHQQLLQANDKNVVPIDTIGRQ